MTAICAPCFLILLNSCGPSGMSSDAAGTFEADEITVSSEATGKIEWLDLTEGQQLQAGQAVGQIDTVQLFLQKQQLEESIMFLEGSMPDIDRQTSAMRSRLKQQLREKDRIERLLEDDAATPKDLEDILSAIEVLEGQIEAQESGLGNTIASLEGQLASARNRILQIEDQLAKCRIASPVDGTVLARYAHAGELAVSGKPLFRVADTRTMTLRAYFCLWQLKDVRIGQRVKVIADFGGDNTREYEGTVSWISDKSEFSPKSIQTKDERENLVYAVKISVGNDGYLKIGMYGEVIL
ncbi:MAG: HlyD family efflux transporter periplasmic adaptor subunit [Bacteroidetes bacterium]|uniref:HlyD family efflux transporter periplasmic adaptor subunit n=1 Tax=Candidatus Cryptobacteroides merdavium TaxID=2840769 RepID=A0A9D9H920_9BACT|nr:HlyD family efflux transporter periplasmic adaptor subunit [Candidatus Cryptobacteroides merdavium]